MLVLAAMATRQAAAQRQEMADASSSESIIAVMRKACDYQLDLQAKNEATNKSDNNFEWVRGAFYTGVMALYEATGDPKLPGVRYQMGRRQEVGIGHSQHTPCRLAVHRASLSRTLPDEKRPANARRDQAQH